jgi:hypothetical protein
MLKEIILLLLVIQMGFTLLKTYITQMLRELTVIFGHLNFK